eukprot:14970017-Alexandrium_andersonii.AAC.1
MSVMLLRKVLAEIYSAPISGRERWRLAIVATHGALRLQSDAEVRRPAADADQLERFEALLAL